MAVKQIAGANAAPDGSQYVTLTDGAGNLISTSAGGGQAVAGDVASGATDSGNPVKVGGKFNSTMPTFTDGQRGDIQINNKGMLFSIPSMVATTGADAFSNSQIGLAVATSNGTSSELPGSAAWQFNGTSWDRVRTLGAGTTAQTSTTGVPISVLVPSSQVGAGIASTANTSAGSSLVLKASAGNLFSISANATAAGFLMVFDATSAPVDGAVTPVFTAVVAANGMFFTDFAYPIKCATGITLVYSSTGPFTKTASATAFLSGQFI